MNLIKKIKRFITTSKNSFPQNFNSESDFYTFLFTQHPKWNKPTPNKSETKRLHVFEVLLNSIKLPENAKIVDFGCGRGWLTFQLLKFGTPVGIEPNFEVVNYAKKLFPEVAFIVGSIEKLAPKTVDLIVCSEVIEHIDVIEKFTFFEKFYETLNHNGFCLVSTPRAEVQQEWLSYRKDKGQPVEDWITEESLEKLATTSGFKIVAKKIIQEHANDPTSPLLDLYQVYLFQKAGNEI